MGGEKLNHYRTNICGRLNSEGLYAKIFQTQILSNIAIVRTTTLYGLVHKVQSHARVVLS